MRHLTSLYPHRLAFAAWSLWRKCEIRLIWGTYSTAAQNINIFIALFRKRANSPILNFMVWQGYNSKYFTLFEMIVEVQSLLALTLNHFSPHSGLISLPANLPVTQFTCIAKNWSNQILHGRKKERELIQITQLFNINELRSVEMQCATDSSINKLNKS